MDIITRIMLGILTFGLWVVTIISFVLAFGMGLKWKYAKWKNKGIDVDDGVKEWWEK